MGCRCSTGCSTDLLARPPSTCRRPRRWPPTSCERWANSNSPGYAPRPTTVTRPTKSVPGCRTHANLVLANPDLVHRSMLPSHRQWASFFRGLSFVVIDECHGYRGVFGSHVAQVVRRLRRVAARYGAFPVFVLASATVSEPATSASRLIGLDVEAVTDDASPRGASRFVLWEPPLMHFGGGAEFGGGAPVRRSAVAETADLLADLVADGVRTLAFVRSRRGAEAVALAARRVARRGVAKPRSAGRRLPRGLPAGRTTGARTPTALGLDRGPGRDDSSRVGRRRVGARRGAAGWIPRHPVVDVAAGGSGRSRRSGVDRA